VQAVCFPPLPRPMLPAIPPVPLLILPLSASTHSPGSSSPHPAHSHVPSLPLLVYLSACPSPSACLVHFTLLWSCLPPPFPLSLLTLTGWPLMALHRLLEETIRPSCRVHSVSPESMMTTSQLVGHGSEHQLSSYGHINSEQIKFSV
jgi:hypothetical protein